MGSLRITRALVWVTILCLLGCKKASVDHTILLSAIDSAHKTAWHLRDSSFVDTLHHSAFYDSVLRYIRTGVEIEREKRLDAEQFSALNILRSENLQSKKSRSHSLGLVERRMDNERSWKGRLDTLYRKYSEYLARTADTVYREDESAKQAFIAGALKRDYFIPVWRPGLDSLQEALTAAHKSLIVFFDTTHSRVSFEEGIRFSDPAAALNYDSIRKQLDELSRKEIEYTARVKAEQHLNHD
jgi:hypothetical protein